MAKRHSDIKYKRSGGAKVVFAAVFVLFALYGFSLFFSFGWALVSSLKTAPEYIRHPFGFPSSPRFMNYIDALRSLEINGSRMPAMIWNSVWFSFGSVLISITFTSLAAYVTSRYRFFGRGFLYGFAVFMMIIPTYGTFVATYRLYHTLHLVNSYAILLSATGGFSGINYFLLYGYFRTVSPSYAEAAKLDGAGHYKIFFSIMLPLAKPLLVSIFMLSFITSWNDYLSPMLYLSEMPTLSSGLFRYQTIALDRGDVPLLFAGLFISMIPILVLFTFLHETMMTNMSVGGLKG